MTASGEIRPIAEELLPDLIRIHFQAKKILSGVDDLNKYLYEEKTEGCKYLWDEVNEIFFSLDELHAQAIRLAHSIDRTQTKTNNILGKIESGIYHGPEEEGEPADDN